LHLLDAAPRGIAGAPVDRLVALKSTPFFPLVAEKLARSQRRSRFLFALVAFAVPVILVLLAGNAGMVYMVGRLTRETQVNKGGEMVAMDATPIQTAKASYARDIFDIARTAAIDMESDEAVGFLQGIKSVTYGDPFSSDPNAAVVAEVTAKAVAAGTMKFDLANGATVLVDAAKGVASLSSASVGVISFDTAGTPKMATTYAMEGDAATTLPNEVLKVCQVAGCANDVCVGELAFYPMHVKKVMCRSVDIWQWPSPAPQTARRQLAEHKRQLWNPWKAMKKAFAERNKKLTGNSN
jgi:hypothetical protein